MRTIGVVTTSRADYGICRPLLKQIAASAGLRLSLMVSGMHLASEFGHTVDEIENDGYAIAARIPTLDGSDTAEGAVRSMGLALTAFAPLFSQSPPDILVVLGDRFEMFAAAVAAVPFGIPLAHVGGGSVTEGAFDDQFRHALTKLAHLHFPETASSSSRLLQMGEEPWRVTVSGALGLDNVRQVPQLTLEEINRAHGTRIQTPLALATYHPVTREHDAADEQAAAFLEALDALDRHVVLTAANADPAGRALNRRFAAAAASNPSRMTFVESLGTNAYFSLMRMADLMVGNSSSGLVEAASFELPVVNVGSRQAGRLRPANVIDVAPAIDAIRRGFEVALSLSFKQSLVGLQNPYGDGQAASRMVAVLEGVQLGSGLLTKKWHSVPANRDGAGRPS